MANWADNKELGESTWGDYLIRRTGSPGRFVYYCHKGQRFLCCGGDENAEWFKRFCEKHAEGNK